MSLSGLWRLDHGATNSQIELLKAMERPFWQLQVINKSDEDFRLFHFHKPEENIHFFDKKVNIYLASIVLKILSKIINIPYDQVSYKHKLTANSKRKDHEPDAKEFGKCYSICSWEKNSEGHNGLMIRWFIKPGLLKVFHHVNDNDRLVCNMHMQNSKGKDIYATKRYKRIPFRPDDEKELQDSKYLSFYRKPAK